MNADSIKHVDLLLSEFGSARGIAGATLSEAGTCALNHEDGLEMVLELSQDGQTLHWYTAISRVPAEDRESYYARLLSLNLLGQETDGATLALNNLENEIVLCYREPVERLDSGRFNNVTENFLNSSFRLKDQLSQTFQSHQDYQEPLTFRPQPLEIPMFGMRI